MNLYPRLFELAGRGRRATRRRPACARWRVAGDAGDCAAAISALWEAGVDSVVVVPRHEDRVAQVARFVADVLPRLA